jgi:predicted NBD/HSP70 family sugar kinase
LLQEALPAPVYVDNDTKAAAMAERLFGVCQGTDDFVYITGHSGIGGGLFLDGRLYRGSQGFAGEIGHVTVVPGGHRCGCGKLGCLETYVSEAAILRDAATLGYAFDDLFAVAEAARAGQRPIRTLLAQAGSHLGFAIAHLVNLVDPELVVLGGNLTIVADFITEALHATLAANVLAPILAKLRFQVSPLGAEAVPMGGIALAMDGYLSAPHIATSLRPTDQ